MTDQEAGSPKRKILEITSYPPPRAGWGVRVEYVKRQLEADGHECLVLNIGMSRKLPSEEYETVLGAFDYVRKVWRFSRQGFNAHVHVNGKSPKGFVLAIVGEVLSLLAGRRSVLTFHAGCEQTYFPRPKYRVLLPMFWLLFTMPHRIICNDERVKAKIVEYGVEPKKVVPIPAFSRQYLEAVSSRLPDDLDAFYARFDEVVLCYLNIQAGYYPEVALDAFSTVGVSRPRLGLVLCGTAGHRDETLWRTVQDRLPRRDLRPRVMVVEDLAHDVFIEALRRADVYLRTPPGDGVCSSVLEALSLRVPVVAAENGSRPPGVKTYEPDRRDSLATTLSGVLANRDAIARALIPPPTRDTVYEEIGLLTA